MAKTGILFSTKGKYTYSYGKWLAWTIIPGVITAVVILLCLSYELAFFAEFCWGFFIVNECVQPLLIKKSYVEIHKTYIQGVSIGKIYKEGTAFIIKYTDIIHVDAGWGR